MITPLALTVTFPFTLTPIINGLAYLKSVVVGEPVIDREVMVVPEIDDAVAALVAATSPASFLAVTTTFKNIPTSAFVRV
jgi:hypothetical protein